MRPSPISSLISALPRPGVYGTKARYKAGLVLLALGCALAVALAGGAAAAATPDRSDRPDKPSTPPADAQSVASTPAAKSSILTAAAKAAAPAPAAVAMDAAKLPPVQMDTPTPVPTPLPAYTADTDREALIAFYNATGGANWQKNEWWLGVLPMDEWQGVATNKEGRVISLLLGGNQLSGAIPPELDRLSWLENLNLSDNQLSGAIPPELGRLSRLKGLGLWGKPVDRHDTARVSRPAQSV